MRQNIVEFAGTFDPRIQGFLYVQIAYLCLVVVAVSFAVGWKRTDTVAVLLAVVFGLMALQTIRYTAWLGLASAYILAANLRGLGGTVPIRKAGSVVLAALLVLGTVLSVAQGNVRGKPIGFENLSPLSPSALDYILESSIKGNIFNSYRFGDQLVYQFYPRIRVSIDSRADAYGEEYYLLHRSLAGRSGPQLAPVEKLVEFLDSHDMRTIITRPFDFGNWQRSGLLPTLSRQGWREVYRDSSTVILRR